MLSRHTASAQGAMFAELGEVVDGAARWWSGSRCVGCIGSAAGTGEREREAERPLTVVAMAFGRWRCRGEDVVFLGRAGVEGCG